VRKNIAIGVVIIVVVLLILNRSTFLNRGISVTDSPAVTPSITISIPDGWQIYEDNVLQISFAHPKEYEIEKNGEYSILAKPPENKNYPAGNTRFFYVSVVPGKLLRDETAQVYNYSFSFHKKLLAIPVDETRNLSDNDGQKEWYSYERNPDTIFNGKTARVFINRRPWEFPNGTLEYRYVFEFSDKTVIAGAYIEGGQSDTFLTFSVLEKIMNTFSIR